MKKIYLSSPHIGPAERRYVADAFDTNWIAPLGPQVDAFEEEFAAVVEVPHAAALASGTAALHLLMWALDIGPGDEVITAANTFMATAGAMGRPCWSEDPSMVAMGRRWPVGTRSTRVARCTSAPEGCSTSAGSRFMGFTPMPLA